MSDYKRLTFRNKYNQVEVYNEFHDREPLQRLADLEDKIEQGTLIECDTTLIGQSVIGIHHYTNDTYSLELDENIVIGFCADGIVTWNDTHKYNDYFTNGLYFLDTDKGRAEAEQRLKELKGEV